MAKPGPKTKPLNVKQLNGDIHKERWNQRQPQPDISRTSCPAHLNAIAKTEWRRVVPLLIEQGTMTKIDRAALAAYCQNYARWVEAERRIATLASASPDKLALLYKTTNGNLIISPMLSIANKSLELMHKFLVEFGMTPSSRNAVNGNKDKDIDDELDEFLNGNRKN